mmetsp:Transcript_6107/g.13176  ORF Transcript_6107/g.13176 Transcript_6107/m.13176 type:complete len:375 (-) Transcript_6107:83-1207(-)
MTILSHWVPRLSPIFLLVSTAEKDSCPDNANAALGESSCSSSSSRLEKPLDFVALADDLLAMNQSSGNKLHEIRRVPCSGDWFFADEPIILEGCCWALESAFQKGEEVPDCSNEEDFLALDHFNISHDFFLEHCGAEDFNFWHDQDFFQEYLSSLEDETDEARRAAEEGLDDIFGITLNELTTVARNRRNMAQYSVEKRRFQVNRQPKHVLGYFNPLSYGAMKSLWCPALKQQVYEKGFPTLSLYRQLPQFSHQRYENRRNHWESKAVSFVVPKASCSVPTHLHFENQVSAVLLTEGKKHWQFVAATPDSFSDLQPFPGVKRLSQSFQKVPIELADEHPVYVGTQLPGEVILPPRNWVHLAYSIEDSVSIVFPG